MVNEVKAAEGSCLGETWQNWFQAKLRPKLVVRKKENPAPQPSMCSISVKVNLPDHICVCWWLTYVYTLTDYNYNHYSVVFLVFMSTLLLTTNNWYIK